MKQKIKSLLFFSFAFVFLCVFSLSAVFSEDNLLVVDAIGLNGQDNSQDNSFIDKISIPNDKLIQNMQTEIIGAGDNFVAALSVDGTIQMYFKMPKDKNGTDLSNYNSQNSDINKQDKSDLSFNEPANNNEKSNVDQSNGDDKKTNFEKNIDEIKDYISTFNDVINISCGPESITIVTNANEIAHVDFQDNKLNNESTLIFSPSKKIEMTSDGDKHFSILYTDGTVETYVSGDVAIKKELKETANWSDIIQISSGENHITGIKKDLSVVTAGINNYGQKEVSSLKNIAHSISAANFSIYLNTDGRLNFIGNTNNGQNDISNIKNCIAVSTTTTDAISLNADGKVQYIGKNQNLINQLIYWRNILAVKSGKDFIIGLDNAGKLLIAQDSENWQINIDRTFTANQNEIKLLSENQIKLKEVFDLQNAKNQYALENNETRERNKEIRIIAACIISVGFIIVVVIYCYVLKKKNKRI